MKLIVKTVKPINLTEEQQAAYDASLANPVIVIEKTEIPNLYVVRAKKFVPVRAEDGQSHIMGLTDTVVKVEGGVAQFLPIEAELTKNVRLRNTTPFVEGQLAPIFEFRNMNNPILGWEDGNAVAYLLLTPFTEAAEQVDEEMEVDFNPESTQEDKPNINSEEVVTSTDESTDEVSSYDVITIDEADSVD